MNELNKSKKIVYLAEDIVIFDENIINEYKNTGAVMKGIILSLAIVSLIAASFTADARGHRGGGGHRSYSHSFSSGYSSQTKTPRIKKRYSSAKRTAIYATAGAAGYGAYQAHNYTSSYVREKDRQAARKSSTNNDDSQYQNQPQAQPVSQNMAPTCSPLSMTSQPSYTNLPVCLSGVN
ncbi:hypothetical protein AAIH18_11490 [Pantoea agglomerans]|uniref:hypothetical protein n=1 Tax=Enterobacter agglomerans TaxID=549 RepID=UPI003D2776B2